MKEEIKCFLSLQRFCGTPFLQSTLELTIEKEVLTICHPKDDAEFKIWC